MARVLKNILGFPSGRVGDLVYRISKGKVYVYPYKPRPKRQGTEAEQARWRSFGFIARLASVLNKSETLRNIWDKANVSGSSPFTKIQKYNIRRECSLENIDRAAIVPGSVYFQAQVQQIFFSGGELAIAVKIIDGMNCLSTVYTPEMTACGFMLLQEPQDETLPVSKLIPLCSKSTKFTGSELMLFNIPIVGGDLNLLGKYGVRKFVVVLMTVEIYSEHRYCSNNLTGTM